MTFFGITGEAVFDPTVAENAGFVGVQAGLVASIGPPIKLEVHAFQSVTPGIVPLNDFQYILLRGLLPLGNALSLCEGVVQLSSGGFTQAAALSPLPSRPPGSRVKAPRG